MDVHDKLEEITRLVEHARSMPMSASAIVNRAELLGLLEDLRALLPEEFHHAELVLADRDSVIAEGSAEAERMIADAHKEQAHLVGETEVLRVAQQEAARLHAEAEDESERQRRETEEFVDGRLANFEVVLTRTLATVTKGRERMRAREGEGWDAPAEHSRLDQPGHDQG